MTTDDQQAQAPAPPRKPKVDLRLPDELNKDTLDELVANDIVVKRCLSKIALWQKNLVARRKKIRKIIMMKFSAKAARQAKLEFAKLAKKHGLTPK